MAAIQSLNLNPLEQDVSKPRESPSWQAAQHDEALPDSYTFDFMNDQQILNGTALRDILFRSFQPSDAVAQPQTGRASPTDVLPTDVDATPMPSQPAAQRGRGAFWQHAAIASWADRYRRPNPVRFKTDPPLNLNPSQMRAIALMLGERLSLVQGVRLPA
jgi:hypothetical protein